MRATFRPMAVWPHPATPDYKRRSTYTFKAPWSDTLRLLEYEIVSLAGIDVVIGGGWREQDIRLDGLPRSDAREPVFPGVELSFEVTRDGSTRRLVYATDVCAYWQHNVRSIALGLESLRAVDRYGITRHGEQYAGFAQLAAGGPSADRGKRLIEQAGSIRDALFKHHPDQGGDPRDFADVQAYRQALGL